MKDTIYQRPQPVVDFEFDERVVSVFPDMINRSVPGYATIIKMIGMLAERHVSAGTRAYDLGCSLGASTLAMRHHIKHDNVRIIAVDNSSAMINGLQRVLDADRVNESVVVESKLADIDDVLIENASMVVLNFTLQFIPKTQRDAIIQRIYSGLVDGGILVLSEKVAFESTDMNELMIDLHHSFKQSQGYSQMEIAAKRNALENVLLPESLNTHQQRFTKAGFAHHEVWFQCLNFASMIAIKGKSS